MLQRMVWAPELRGTAEISLHSCIFVSVECHRPAVRDFFYPLESDPTAPYRPVAASQVRSAPGDVVSDNDCGNSLIRLPLELGSLFSYSMIDHRYTEPC